MGNYLPITSFEKDTYAYVNKRFDDFLNETVLVRTSSYKGKGRPRKSDFIRIPRKLIPDFRAFEIFSNGFKSNL
jgi:hypothetical protein